MPRLRSQTRRPALRLLPREVLARCIEFLPFDQALEAWDDPRLAARFVFALLLEQLDPDIEFVDISDHRRWSRDWQVRDKADAFVEAARALRVYGVPVSEGY